ncbi:MAG: hypothetical protein S4CHLAM20_06290 [Chlamydiia bacterium]|nr:hypothetical protein [Chlamydiia bacterium]
MSITPGLQPQPVYQPINQPVFPTATLSNENKQSISFHCVCECLKAIVHKIVQFCKWVWDKIVNLCKNLAGGSSHQRITLEALSQQGILPNASDQPYDASNCSIFLGIIGLSFNHILGAEKTSLINRALSNSNLQTPIHMTTNELDRLRMAPLIAFRLADWLSRDAQTNDFLFFEPQSFRMYLSSDVSDRLLLSKIHPSLFQVDNIIDFYADLKEELIERFPLVLTKTNTEGIISENTRHINDFLYEDSE